MDLLRCALPAEVNPELADALGRPFLATAAREALEAARARPSHATVVLARWFREVRKLGSRDRPRVAEAVHGVIRHESLLRAAGFGGDPELIVGWRQLVAGDRLPSLPSTGSDVGDYAVAMGVSAEIATEWLERLGPEEAGQLGATFATRAPLTLRANRLKADREAVALRLLAEGAPTRPCTRAPDGLQVLKRVNLEGLPSFREGLFEVQDEASQLLIDALGPLYGARVLDLCAGAGGKSLALAARGARVDASDSRSNALERLRERAARAGANVRVGPPSGRYDLVLVDAPCTGSGRLRRDPALRWGLDPAAQVPLQRRLLDGGAAWVQPGGRLVYATCSLLRAENEHEPSLPGFTLASEHTLWPHREGTDGFSWRIWTRAG